MENADSFSTMAPQVVDRENYQSWAMKINVYLESCDFWETVEEV